MDTNEFIEDFLKHEYDPVKAREYYLRTRKLKGRKPGKGVKPADPRSNRTMEGDPLPKLGTRMHEDQTPDVSPSGAKLIDYDGKGLGRAVYADGQVYDARVGWSQKGQAEVNAGKAKVDANRAKNGMSPLYAKKQRRISQAEQKLIRARTLANKVKDPAKKEAILKKLRLSEERLRNIESATHRKRSKTA